MKLRVKSWLLLICILLVFLVYNGCSRQFYTALVGSEEGEKSVVVENLSIDTQDNKFSGETFASLDENAILEDGFFNAGVGDEESVELFADGESPAEDLGDVFFDFDSAMIRSDAQRILEANANTLKSLHQGKSVRIAGHCDERGTAEYNVELGMRRARATMHYLVDLGVPTSQIEIVSYGKERPFCLIANEDCWKLNRRGKFSFSSKN